MNKMIEMLRNVNLSSLRNEKSLDDLIERCLKEGRKQGALEELKLFLEFNGKNYMDKTYIQIKVYCEDRIKELEGEIKHS